MTKSLAAKEYDTALILCAKILMQDWVDTGVLKCSGIVAQISKLKTVGMISGLFLAKSKTLLKIFLAYIYSSIWYN